MIFRAILLSAACSFIAAAAVGQKLANLKASFDGEKMVVTYDLISPEPNQKFKVTFYSSHDNYSRALSLITGDAGESVSPGQGNRVVWDAKSTLPADFDADVTIKIKVNKIAAKLNTKPLDKTAFKPGDSLTLRWAGGDPGGKVNVVLFKNEERQLKVAEGISNKQEVLWVIPKGVKGKGYVLRVSSVSNETELSNSQLFTIKPKVPLYLKILPIAVIGIGGAAIAVAGGGGETPTGDDELPGPVKPN